MKKISLLILLLVLVLLGGCANPYQKRTAVPAVYPANDQALVGNDRDAHGCIGSAGYSWCEAKQKCLRIWEESCNATTTDTSGWKIYDNAKLDFSLKFPQTWDGYQSYAGDYPGNSYVGFSFKGSHQPFEIFKIIRYTKAQWEKEKNTPGFKILNQTSDATLVCDGCCTANGEFNGGGQFDQFQIARCQEAPQIINTFQLK
jgi:hypothetical protein